jgi:hypothetical protein
MQGFTAVVLVRHANWFLKVPMVHDARAVLANQATENCAPLLARRGGFVVH